MDFHLEGYIQERPLKILFLLSEGRSLDAPKSLNSVEDNKKMKGSTLLLHSLRKRQNELRAKTHGREYSKKKKTKTPEVRAEEEEEGEGLPECVKARRSAGRLGKKEVSCPRHWKRKGTTANFK